MEVLGPYMYPPFLFPTCLTQLHDLAVFSLRSPGRFVQFQRPKRVVFCPWG